MARARHLSADLISLCYQWLLRLRSTIVLVIVWPFLLMGLSVCFPPPVSAEKQDEPPSDIDFTDLSLEELKSIQIISASKRPESLSDLPSAVFVITQQDIRRSGATSIPELLRMVPGVQVGRISATDWAVSIRDLNQLFANKLLVLIDGRSVYSHIASGVFWDIHDTVLEDIERIEVIRGPGAALWGVNAVNGVINIITKAAEKTHGYQIALSGGTEEAIGSVRYGGTVSETGHYRLYAKGFARGKLSEEGRNTPIDPSKSDWLSGRMGLRVDYPVPGKGDTLTFQGEFFSNQFDTEVRQITLFPPAGAMTDYRSRASGGHLLGKWEHRFSEGSESIFKWFYDGYSKDIETGNVTVHTIDLDFQHRFSPWNQHDLIWGLNWRFISDRFADALTFAAEPDHQNTQFCSVFLQDQIELVPDRLHMTLGSKFEYNDYTGWEIQPSIRGIYTLNDRHSFWGAISRASRIPSRIEQTGILSDIVSPSHAADQQRAILIQEFGNTGLDAENVVAYELGYRYHPLPDLQCDLTGFYNDYHDLIAIRYAALPETGENPISGTRIPLIYENNLSGQSYGVETAVQWQATPVWLLQGAYTYLKTKISQNLPDVGGIESLLVRASNPNHQVSLRSNLDLPRDVDLDLWLRYVDRHEESDISEYITLDARLAWQVNPHIELSLVGQNLLQPRHQEFSSIEIERGFYVKLDWWF